MGDSAAVVVVVVVVEVVDVVVVVSVVEVVTTSVGALASGTSVTESALQPSARQLDTRNPARQTLRHIAFTIRDQEIANVRRGSSPATSSPPLARSNHVEVHGVRRAFMQAMGLVNDHVPGCDCREACKAERAALVRPTHRS